MRFIRSDSFKADYRRLSELDKELVRSAVMEFSAACDRYVSDATPFPLRLRVKAVKGAPGVFEMTWSFAGPDGRATWDWADVQVVDDSGTTSTEPAVRWRRIGDHRIFRQP